MPAQERPTRAAHQASMMAPPRQKSMAMGAPMKKGIDTALGSGTNFLYGRGTTKSCRQQRPHCIGTAHGWWASPTGSQPARQSYICMDLLLPLTYALTWRNVFAMVTGVAFIP